MPTATAAPADTTMMSVVHDALRRDFNRLLDVLPDSRSLESGRATALAEHVTWMVGFLHHHHQSEDDGLWPLIVAKDPQAATLIEEMESDHRVISPRMEAAEAAARAFGDAPQSRTVEALLDALRALLVSLLPHLDREEREAMAFASSALTNAEWLRWDKTYNVKPKSLGQLGREAHWLMDGLDAARVRTMMALVPPPVRVVIVRGFSRQYRRGCDARWGTGVSVGPLNP